MKKHRNWQSIGLVLTGLLILAAIAITIGSERDQWQPSPNSYAQGGTAAFADLMRRRGYEVVSTRTTHPDLRSDDLALVFHSSYQIGSPVTEETDRPVPLRASLQSHLKAGGKILVASVEPNWVEFKTTQSEDIINLQGKKLRVTLTGLDSPFSYSRTGDLDQGSITLWASQDPKKNAQLAMLEAYEKGRILSFSGASPFSNLLIGRDDNAEWIVSTIRSVAPDAKRLVVLEAAFGNASDPGLLELIGPWALAGWRQLLLLGAVIVFTLGIRFGVAQDPRHQESGQRELLEGVAETYRRSKANWLAVETIHREVDRQLRIQNRIPLGVETRVRDKHLSEEARSILGEVEALLARPRKEVSLKAREAQLLCAKLTALLEGGRTPAPLEAR